MASLVLSQISTTMLAPSLYEMMANGASIAASGALWSAAQGITGALGTIAGSVLDRMLFAADQNYYGPRLNDLTVQTSTEGASLPIVYGTMRLAGNVIWSTGLQELSHTEEQGGGSGGGGGSYTTYTYRTDCAIAVCEGTITGIRRIWADTKLIYDAGDTASIETLTASAQNNIRFYTGSETQLCDPLIQAVESTDLAYRGTAYVVFEDFELANYGNRLPNFSFEVVKSSLITNNILKIQTPIYNVTSLYYKEQIIKVESGVISTITSTEIIKAYTTDDFRATASPSLSYSTVASPENVQYSYTGNIATIGIYGIDILAYKGFGASSEGLVFVDASNNVLYSFGSILGTDKLYMVVPCTDGIHVLVVPSGSASTWSQPTAGTYANGEWFIIDTRNKIVVKTGNVKTIPAGYQQPYANYNTVQYSSAIMEADLKHLWLTTPNAGFNRIVTHLYTIDDTNNDLSLDYTYPEHSANNASFAHSIWADAGICYVAHLSSLATINNNSLSIYSRINQLPIGTQTVKEVVEDLVNRVDIPSSKYDFSNLSTETIRGYTVTHQMKVAEALSPITATYKFDISEEDAKLKSKLYNAATSLKTFGIQDIGGNSI